MTRTPNIISCWFVACEFLCRTKKNKHFSRINAFVLSDLIKVFRARARSQSSASWVDTFGIRLLLSNWIELGSMENVVSKRKTHCFRLVFCRPSIISWAENLYTYIFSMAEQYPFELNVWLARYSAYNRERRTTPYKLYGECTFAVGRHRCLPLRCAVQCSVARSAGVCLCARYTHCGTVMLRMSEFVFTAV